jgi:GxxExxY protein
MNQKSNYRTLPCNELTEQIITGYYQTLNGLGTVRGTPVSAFRSLLANAIRKQGLRVQIGKVIEVHDKRQRVIDLVKIEMIVEGLVVVNIKNVRALTTQHFASGTYQMEVGGYPVGLLLNYGEKDRKPRRLTPPRHYRKGPWKCPGA